MASSGQGLPSFMQTECENVQSAAAAVWDETPTSIEQK